VDNGDGTITDFDNGLVWEKKVTGSSSSTDSRGVGNCLNCVDDVYVWTTAMSQWISTLNGRTDDSSSQAGFAGHTDWRLPTIGELKGILTAEYPNCTSSPCIDPIFSPTALGYLSASSSASFPDDAWVVNFDDGSVAPDRNASHVRAVRTGP